MSSLNPPLNSHTGEWSARPSAVSRLVVRMRVLMQRTRLDRALAEGTDPMLSDELMLRAGQLTGANYRRALADTFDEVICIAEGQSPRLTSSPPLARREVRAARAALLDLSRSLREDAPVNPAGVALAERLLTDGLSPLYLESGHDALWHAARLAGETLRERV